MYTLSAAVARSSSDGNVICYVLPVLWMTSCFHIIERMGRIRDDAYVSSSSPGGSTGDEVCHLPLHLVRNYCFQCDAGYRIMYAYGYRQLNPAHGTTTVRTKLKMTGREDNVRVLSAKAVLRENNSLYGGKDLGNRRKVMEVLTVVIST